MNTKKHFITKRIGALLMAVAMMCTMAVCASAANVGTYSVNVKKNNSTDPSMAQAAIAGEASVEETNGIYTVTIPVKAFDKKFLGSTYKGCIVGAKVAGATDESVPTQQYDTATLSFKVNELPADMKFDVKLTIELYKLSGNGSFTHPPVNADFYLQ